MTCLSRLAFLNMIERLEGYRCTQQELDVMYNEFTDAIFNEMNVNIPRYIPGKSRQYHKALKSY